MVSEKFKRRYRIPSSRLSSWDYSSNGMYYVTICTKNREHHFGKITGHKMELSEIGLIAEKYWFEIPNHFRFVKLDEFVVMPNHIHGIIIIEKPNDGIGTVETPKLGVSTDTTITGMYVNAGSKTKKPDATQKKWKPGTLGVIINQYKRVCTLYSRKINPDFFWQSRFYDNVIRDKKSFNKIAGYIRDNPLKWEHDIHS